MKTLTFKSYPSYKLTGIVWPKHAPIHWEIKRLKDIGESSIGLTYAPEDIVDETIQGRTLVLRSSNIQNNALDLSDAVYVKTKIPERLRVKTGDILICSRNGSRALIGKNICIDERVAGQTFGAFMTIFRTRYYKYLSKFFNSSIFEVQSGLYMSSTVNQLTQNTLNNFFILLPPIPEQQAIVDYLDTHTAQVDRRIDLLTQKAQKYVELKQALVGQVVKTGVDKKANLKESGVEWLGNIPAHWEVTRVSDIASQQKIKNTGLREKNLLSLSYGKLKRKNIENNFGLLPESFETYQIVNQGNVILRLTDLQNDWTSLRVGLARERGIITSAYLCLRFSKQVDPGFAYYLLHFYDLSKVFYWLGNGLRSTMKFEDIKILPFLVPPLEEQQAIAAYLDVKTAHIEKIIATIKSEIEKLRELRKTLINDVVTGKIKVWEGEVSAG